jgi:aminomethyltransferase
MPEFASVKRTPLNAAHRRLGAKMINFSGWEMPVQYSGILDEHHAVRRSVGVFDVSHMGEIEIRGPEALTLVQYVTANDAARLEPGAAQYSALLNENGGFVDDIIVHKVAQDHYFLCVNAANQEKDYDYIRTANCFVATVEFISGRYAQLAIQGPSALSTLRKLTAADLSLIRRYHFLDREIIGVPARIARTGYTGEDGFELYIPSESAEVVWDRILDAGQEFGIKPCGLGARNTLRLEAAMALYGHEINDFITPFEANLGWIVKMNKGEFLGRRALARQLEEGVQRKLAGFQMRGRSIARDSYKVMVNGREVGWVTSGGPSPTLNRNIGLCYLPPEFAVLGQLVTVAVRDHLAEAEIVPTPFYKREK